MLRTIKLTALILVGVAISANAFSQNKIVNITGEFTEKTNAEIIIGTKTQQRSYLLASYKLDTTSTHFAFAIPVINDAQYFITINLMKMGHMRLERENTFKYPLNISAGKNVDFTITPSLLDTSKNTGIQIGAAKNDKSVATIDGYTKNLLVSAGDLQLQKVMNGTIENLQTVSVFKNTMDSFHFAIPVTEEGFYYISTPRWQKRVYLKPNDHLQATIDLKNSDIEWAKTSEENSIIKQWEELIWPITNYGYYFSKINPNYDKVNVDSFVLAHRQLQPKIEAFVSQVKTGNQKFNELFRTAAEVDNNLTALNLLYHVSAEISNGGFKMHPKDFKNVPVYFQQFFKAHPLNNTKVLQTGEGNYYINLYAKWSLSNLTAEEKQKLTESKRLQTMLLGVANDTLKAFVLKTQLNEIEIDNLSQFNSTFLPLKKYAIVPEAKEKYDHVFQQFADDTTFIGHPIKDIKLPDVNGKMVSLRSYKGKVVVIDTWATWCGPCREQVPYLKEIEEEYKNNKDVVFVGISSDKKEDEEKWRKMVKDMHLEGVQLIDYKGLTFVWPHKISAIPRFLVIDKNSKWVEVRCPKPEKKEKFKAYIDEALTTK